MASPVDSIASSIHGDLDTFHLDLTYFGISTINPNQFLHNCVSVTIAKLLAYRDVHEFWRDTLHRDLPDAPLTFRQIKQLLSMTGWEFTWKIYRPRQGRSAYLRMQDDSSAHFPLNSPLCAVLYTRKNGSGHCVTSTAGINFICYQQDKYGASVLPEVRRARRVVTIFLHCPRNTPQHRAWLDRQYLRMMERRRDPVWWARRQMMLNQSLKILGLEPVQLEQPTTEDEEPGAPNKVISVLGVIMHLVLALKIWQRYNAA